MGNESESTRRHKISNEIYLLVESHGLEEAIWNWKNAGPFLALGYGGPLLERAPAFMFLKESQSLWREEVKTAFWIVTKGVCWLARELGFQRAQEEWLSAMASVGSLGLGLSTK